MTSAQTRDAWVRTWSTEHQAYYWANKITYETTWDTPPCLTNHRPQLGVAGSNSRTLGGGDVHTSSVAPWPPASTGAQPHETFHVYLERRSPNDQVGLNVSQVPGVGLKVEGEIPGMAQEYRKRLASLPAPLCYRYIQARDLIKSVNGECGVDEMFESMTRDAHLHFRLERPC